LSEEALIKPLYREAVMYRSCFDTVDSSDCRKTLERVTIKTILMTELTLTAVYEEAEEGGYVGYVAELPGANTQGETLEEVRENLNEAIQLILEVNRIEFERNLSRTAKVIREQLILRAT